MKTLLKLVVVVLVLFAIIVIGGIVYVNNSFPKVSAASDIEIEVTPERIERGEYLANHVALCMDCHSERDWNYFAGPPKEGTMGVGGELFDQKMGFPGAFYSRNITPYALDNWTDGEILRAITSGVSKDGQALFPVMPWPAYAKMDIEDLYSIIAYIRSLEAIEGENQVSEADFPMNIILKTMPKDVELDAKRPDRSDRIKYGEYVANIAACTECHTKQEKGQITGEPFAGGFEFQLREGVLRSANITPDHEHGIGSWTQEQFIERFKSYSSDNYQTHKVSSESEQTIMPWLMYADMDHEDLAAIWDFLQSVEPVNQEVERYTSNQ